MELTLTITPDTAAAILNTVQPAALRFFQSVVEAVREAWQGVKKAAKAAGKIMARLAGKCMDAKKYRVRKKYRRRLEQQLCDKLLAAAAG